MLCIRVLVVVCGFFLGFCVLIVVVCCVSLSLVGVRCLLCLACLLCVVCCCCVSFKRSWFASCRAVRDGCLLRVVCHVWFAVKSRCMPTDVSC